MIYDEVMQEKQSFSVYEPAEDSYLLEEQVKKYAFGKVLDVGTGSGIQAIAASALKKVKSVLAVDIQKDVVDELNKKLKEESKNKKTSKKEKSNLKKIKVKRSDLFSNIKQRFDTIIFNPPYLPLDKREPEDNRLTTTGGKHGYETLQRLLLEIDNHLTKKGIALILFSSLTNKEKVEEILNKIGYEFKELSKQHISFETLYVYEIKRNSLMEELFNRNIKNIKQFMKGHRGMIYTGNLNGKKVAVKAQRLDIDVRTIERESGMIAKVNKQGIAPKLILKEKNYFVYDFAEGEFIIDYLERENKQKIKKLLLETLRQCRVLDEMRITKEEMHNPYKHVIVGKKVVLVDFERAHVDLEPKNVTQFCQYIIRNQDLLEKKEIKFEKEDLINLTREYRKNLNETNYKKIKSFVKMF